MGLEKRKNISKENIEGDEEKEKYYNKEWGKTKKIRKRQM